MLKNTDLQVSYNYNMVAIVNGRPMTVGILKILDAYIDHQREVITRRSKFDLDVYKERMHIIEGLIKALSILDDVIKTIRASKNKADAEINLTKEYGFTDKQSKAIVALQLYKLTNTDVTELKAEFEDLKNKINALELILSDENKLKSLMKYELKKVRDEYGTPRKTEIRDEITEIKIDTVKMIPKEDVIVVVSNEGYIKRLSNRSMESSDGETGLKELDYVIGKYKMNTMDTLLLFTDKGNYLYIPVYEIPDMKWKDLGKHVSNIISISAEENIIASLPVYDFDKEQYVTIFTKNGMVKRTKLNEFKALRYSKPITCIKLKDDDKVVDVKFNTDKYVFVSTNNGYGLTYKLSEVPIVGLKTSGVKSISLKNDFVVSSTIYGDNLEYLTVITNKMTGKRIKLSEFEVTSRARKGVQIVREIKTNPYYILKTFIINYKETLGLKLKTEIIEIKLTEIPIMDRYSTGSSISKSEIVDVFETKILEFKEEVNTKIEKENIDLDTIDQKMMTIDDFLKEL